MKNVNMILISGVLLVPDKVQKPSHFKLRWLQAWLFGNRENFHNEESWAQGPK